MTIKLNPSRFLFYLAIILIVSFIYVGAVCVAVDNAPADGAEDRLSSIDEIRLFSGTGSEQASGGSDIKATDIVKRVLDLSSLRSACERLILSMTDLEKIKKEKMAAKDRYENYRAEGMAKKPPYTLTFLDSVMGNLLSNERYQKNIDQGEKQ